MSLPPGSPPTLNYGTPRSADNFVRQVAVRQRAIMWCILFYICAFVLYFAVVLETKSLIAVGLGMLVVVGVIVLTVVCVFRLALSIYSTATAITVGILTLIPYLGILILLIINSKATKILRTNGIKVGLMGAKVKQIPMT